MGEPGKRKRELEEAIERLREEQNEG